MSSDSEPVQEGGSGSGGAGRAFDDRYYDVPAQRPAVEIALDRAGIVNQLANLSWADELLGPTTALVETEISVPLDPSQRGAHMSRFGRLLHATPEDLSLAQLAAWIAERAADVQKRPTATVRLEGTVLVPSRTEVTHLPVTNGVTMGAAATASPGGRSVSTWLELTNITACPCMQAYAAEELVRAFDLEISEPDTLTRMVPIATHSQKGHVRLEVTGHNDNLTGVGSGRLYRALIAGCHPTVDLLKRQDEYALVRRAHLRAQFVEDVVRDVFAAAAVELQSQDGELDIVVTATSLESIHGHDVQASARHRLADLRAAGHGG